MTGGMGGRSEPAPAQQDAVYGQQQQPYYASEQQQAGGGPCQWEMKQFIECAQNQYDITLCQGFNDALKQCRLNAGRRSIIYYQPCEAEGPGRAES